MELARRDGAPDGLRRRGGAVPEPGPDQQREDPARASLQAESGRRLPAQHDGAGPPRLLQALDGGLEAPAGPRGAADQRSFTILVLVLPSSLSLLLFCVES